MARYTANEILVMLDQEECMNEVITNGSDEEFEYEKDR